MIWFFEWLERGNYRNDMLFLCCIITFCVCAALFCPKGSVEFSKRDAIQHNAAQWVIVDPATGRTEFKWNDELTTQGVTR